MAVMLLFLETELYWELARVVRRHLLPETAVMRGANDRDGFGDPVIA
jgi:hypothetical protein